MQRTESVATMRSYPPEFGKCCFRDYSLCMTSLVMLDFDGVIADSVEQYTNSHRQTFEHYSKPVPFSDFRAWYDSTWENNWIKGGFSREELGPAVKMCIELVDYRAAPLFPGIAEALGLLRQAAIVTVVSTTPAGTIRAYLEQHGLMHNIRAIYSPKESGSAKINLMRSAISENGASPGRTVMVGDTAADIVPAKALGCRTAGAAYGWYGHARMAALRPDVLVERPEELASQVLGLLAG